MAILNLNEFKVEIKRLKTQLASLEKQTGMDFVAHLDTFSISYKLNVLDDTSKHFHTYASY